MYSGFLWGNHSAAEHREEGVQAFRQQRVREDRIRHLGHRVTDSHAARNARYAVR